MLLAQPHRPGQELVARDRAQALDRGGAGHRVAAIGRAEPARMHRVHHVGAADHARQRHAGRERLADGDQVGHDAGVLDAPERAGAAHAGLHLVVDVEDAVRLAPLVEAADELGRHDGEAALALHRLEDHAGHRGRIDGRLEHPVERVERVGRRDAAIRIRRRRPVDLGRKRPHAALVDELGGQAHRQQRAAVEAAVEGDHRVAARVVAGDLDRVLDRLGARVDQQRLLLVVAGSELAQQAAHLEIRVVGGDREAGVHQLLGLRADRRDDRLGRVAEVEHADAAGEVDVLASVDVGQAGAVGVCGEDRLRSRRRGRRSGRASRDAPRSVSLY